MISKITPSNMSAITIKVAGRIPKVDMNTSATTLIPPEVISVIKKIFRVQKRTPFVFEPDKSVSPYFLIGGDTLDRPCSLGPVGFPYELLPVADRSGFPLKPIMQSRLTHDWIAV